MADARILAEFRIEQTGKDIKVVAQDMDKLDKAQTKTEKSGKKLNKTQDKGYTRMHQGTIQTANSTKNFSKMQQTMDGGGGAGGLVRAYALLAANVFALSAAFGILSRSAQVDTLIESMTQLEIVSGKSIRSVARGLQEASGYGLDFAAALRSTSLAMSAGFGQEQIEDLGKVARNAAVSLGRNMPDALDRIFRGVIKVEPELLDEIGLFVRVNEASAKYASTLGVAVGDLTEFQKRQAFLNEAIEQGTTKFEAFEDVETDPFSKLQTTFTDLTQELMTFINRGILPVINYLSESKLLFGLLFAVIAKTLIGMAVPAMGAFTQSIAANAAASAQAAADNIKDSKMKAQFARDEHIEFMRMKERELEIEARAATAKSQGTGPIKLGVRGKDASRRLEEAMQKEGLSIAARRQIIEQRIEDLKKKQGLAQRQAMPGYKEELATLESELLTINAIEKQQAKITQEIKMRNAETGKPAAGSVAALEQSRLYTTQLKSESLATIAATAEQQGLIAGYMSIGRNVSLAGAKASQAGIQFSGLSKAMLYAKGVATVTAVAFRRLWMALMGPLSVIIMLLPLLQGFARWMGVGGEESKALSAANEKATEVFDTLSKKVEHAQEQMEKFRKEMDAAGQNRASESLKETVATTAKALEDQVKAFDDYVQTANTFMFLWEEGLPAFVGADTLNQIVRNQDAFIKTLQKLRSSGDLSKEMEELLRDYELGGPMQDTILGQIRELAIAENDAVKNMRSALDGAKDSARSFMDSLIIKTDVDKPLASFRQITSALEHGNLSLQERTEYLDEIMNNTAILSMMTKDQENELKFVAQTDEERIEILEEIERMYFRQQEVIIRIKNELKQIDEIQKQQKNTQKLAVSSVKAILYAEERRLALTKEQNRQELQRVINATNLEEATIRMLARRESLVGVQKEFGLSEENIAAVQQAVNMMNQIETDEMNEQLRLATRHLKLDMDSHKVALNILETEIKTTDAMRARLPTLTKLMQFERTGRTDMDTNATFVALIADEKLRNEYAEERKTIEIAISDLKFKIMEEELKHQKRLLEFENKKHREEMNNPSLTQDQRAHHQQMAKLLSGSDGIIKDIDSSIEGIQSVAEQSAAVIRQAFFGEAENFQLSLIELFESTMTRSGAADEIREQLGFLNAIRETTNKDGTKEPGLLDRIIGDGEGSGARRAAVNMMLLQDSILNFADKMEEVFGEHGAFPSAMGRAAMSILDIIDTVAKAEDAGFTSTASKVEVMATAISNSIAAIQSVYSAYMKQRTNEIDQMIDAEKKRDGKSKESLERIKQLEKKKEAIKRKEFETNKKLMIAQAIASTAAGIAGALAIRHMYEFPFATAVAYMIGAMGAAQIAIISKLRYNSTNSSDINAKPQSLSIGKRGQAVDVSRGTTAGELQYLRGGSITGQDIGGAGGMPGGAGGAMGRRGYAEGGEGIVVGERGPEIVTASAPIDITPNYALGGTPTNVNFTINAVDAAGVEDVLMNQRGNIIRMIRDAANENGELFLEDIDTQAYGSRT